MRLLVAVVVALTFAASPPAPTTARWRPDTLAARVWLKGKMPKRQFRCLHRLWSRESVWRVRARGPMTPWGRAYGIPQALPGRKMRSAGKDWRTNAMTQVRWGLRYVKARYGKPCRALRFHSQHGWY